MFKRSTDQSAGEMLRNNGFIALQFSGNIAVIRTRPGYASSMAYDCLLYTSFLRKKGIAHNRINRRTFKTNVIFRPSGLPQWIISMPLSGKDVYKRQV